MLRVEHMVVTRGHDGPQAKLTGTRGLNWMKLPLPPDAQHELIERHGKLSFGARVLEPDNKSPPPNNKGAISFTGNKVIRWGIRRQPTGQA